MTPYFATGAILSSDDRYRYALWRAWQPCSQWLIFIGLNPSTADAEEDDPTIRRCVAFGKAWGYHGILMLNLFAYRATKPVDMLAVVDPVGPDNDHFLRHYASMSPEVVAAWGAHGAHRGRDMQVRSMLYGRLKCLRVNRDGSPAHPLYLPGSLTPQPWVPQ